MKTTHFKFGLFLALGVTSTMFYSCSKDDNASGNEDGSNVSTITATNVVNGSSAIATVKAETYYGSEYYTIAEAPFQNNGFTLKLPATVDVKYLSLFGTGEDLTGITVSDKTAMVISVEELFAYNTDDEGIGNLFYASADPSGDNNNISMAMWLYVDRNLTVNGQNNKVDEENNEENITLFNNLTLKKGWNIVYANKTYTQNQSTGKETYTITYSNQKPSGVNLKWYFDGSDSGISVHSVHASFYIATGRDFPDALSL